jgi:integrase
MSDMPRRLHTIGWRDVRLKKSGKWESRWADEHGTARGKSWADKAVARKYADDMANAILRGSVGMDINKPVRDALAAFLERRLDPKTTALNERRVNEFLAAMPEVKLVSHLTDSVINRYDAVLESAGHNTGGRNHHLKIVRAFCKFCVEKNWLKVHPFTGFKMPKSDFEGRNVSQDDFDKMCSIGWVGSNERAGINGLGWYGGNQYKDVDVWLRRAFIFGRETMLRISQVWKLTPADFREPGEIRVKGIKHQPTVWVPLTEEALAIARSLLLGRAPGARLFDYWSSVASMQTSVYKKAQRVGLPGLRFHDVCKVSRVSQLDKAGFSIKEISQLSNTTPRTLLAHYIKPEREDTFAKYKRFQNPTGADVSGTKFPGSENTGLPPAVGPGLPIRPTPDRPETENSGNLGGSAPLPGIDSTSENNENESNSR